MPFKILALGPFNLTRDMPWQDEPIKIQPTDLNEAIQRLSPSVYIPFDEAVCPAGGIQFSFESMKDFHPDDLLQKNPVLKNILGARTFCQESKSKGLSQEEIYKALKNWPNLPLIQPPAKAEKTERPSNTAVNDILKLVALPEDKMASAGPSSGGLLDQIDSVLEKILSRLFSHADYRRLEAVWQGLNLLLNQKDMNQKIEIQLVPMSIESLEENLTTLPVHLVRDLPSLMLVDLPFNQSPQSQEGLLKIAQLAETLLSPAACWIVPQFLFLDSWGDIQKLSYLPHYLDEAPFAKWRRLTDSDSARWLAVTCNRFLTRFPYGPDNRPRLVALTESEPLWISPVWAVGALVVQSMAKTGWPTHMTEWQTIRLEDLALNTKKGKSISTETAISENRIDQLIRAGIMPLAGYGNKDIAFVPAEPTVAKGSLGYQLFVSRITHFLLWCKDHLEQGLKPDDLKKALHEAFAGLWQKSGHTAPLDLNISADKPLKDSRIPLHIVVEPSGRALPSGEKVTLEFLW